MHRSLTAAVLCTFALTAAGSCMAANANHDVPMAMQTAKPAIVKSTTAAAPRQGTELIKTAAAGTRDDAPPVVRDATSQGKGDPDHPRRGGTAMLLAALALMTGIALRRFGAAGR